MKTLNMKTLNIISKRTSFCVNGITALLLSVALQADSCWRKSDLAALNDFSQKVNNIPMDTFMDKEGAKMLKDAIRKEKPKKVKIILEYYHRCKNEASQYKNIDFINTPDPISGKTFLEESIIQDKPEIVECLIRSTDIEVNKSSNGLTPIWLALKEKKYDVTNILLNHPNINIKTIDQNSGNTTLHQAIINVWAQPAKKLIELLKRDSPGLLLKINKEGHSPLKLAINKNVAGAIYELKKLDPR